MVFRPQDEVGREGKQGILVIKYVKSFVEILVRFEFLIKILQVKVQLLLLPVAEPVTLCAELVERGGNFRLRGKAGGLGQPPRPSR